VRLPSRPSDYDALADFFNASSLDYPRYAHDMELQDNDYSAGEMRYVHTVNKFQRSAAEYYIFKKGKPEIIGSLVAYMDRQNNARFGYYLSPDARGKGYGAESHSAFIKSFARHNPSLKCLWAEVEPRNSASRRLLMKNGFRPKVLRNTTISSPSFAGERYLSLQRAL